MTSQQLLLPTLDQHKIISQRSGMEREGDHGTPPLTDELLIIDDFARVGGGGGVESQFLRGCGPW